MSTNIYILRLKDDRYYIGKTDNVVKRFQEHMNGNGSAWTRKYKPVELVRTITNASPFDEDRYTEEYMERHGTDKVRGGSYVTNVLTDAQYEVLQGKLRMAKDKCVKCGRPGHFAKNCYAKTEIVEDDSDNELVWACDHCDKEFDNARKCELHEISCGKTSRKQLVTKSAKKISGTCYRCGNPGHYSNNCYAKRHVRGYELDSDDDGDDDDSDDEDYDDDSDY